MIHLKKDRMIRITAGFLCFMMLLCLFGCDGTQIAAETGTTEPVTTMEPPQPAILAPEDMTELPQMVSVEILEENPEFFNQIDRMDKVRQTVYQDCYKNQLKAIDVSNMSTEDANDFVKNEVLNLLGK